MNNVAGKIGQYFGLILEAIRPLIYYEIFRYLTKYTSSKVTTDVFLYNFIVIIFVSCYSTYELLINVVILFQVLFLLLIIS